MPALELKIPPVIVGFVAAALSWAAAKGLPQFDIAGPGLRWVAAGCAGAGVIVSVFGIAAFRRARTTVNPMKPDSASALVATGIYRVSRNPMYLGFLLILIAWAAFLGNALSFLFPAVFVLYMNRFQIEPEEKALAAAFGDRYVAYKAAVRRWI